MSRGAIEGNGISRRRARPCTPLLAAIVLLTGCGGYPVVDMPSANQGSRIDYIVIHFTSENFAESVRLLTTRTDNPVSSHYLIPDPRDDTYERGRPVVFRLVEEHRRAWHAGQSYWGGEEGLNDRSIGIEIVNTSRCESDDPDAAAIAPLAVQCEFVAFDESQLDLLIALLQDLLRRYPRIDPQDVVGHADVAPARKFDPGPLFPWRRLHDAGIGAWYEDDVVASLMDQFGTAPPDTCTVRHALRAWGYGVTTVGDADISLQQSLRAFQMHFRPDHVSGGIDVETSAILFALLQRYRPEELLNLAPDCDPSFSS